MRMIGVGFALSIIASLMVIVVLVAYSLLAFILSAVAVVVMVFAIVFYKVGLSDLRAEAEDNEQKTETIIGIHRLVVTWQGDEPEHLQRFIDALRRQSNDYEHLMNLERQKVARAQQMPYPPFVSKN